MAKHTPGPWDVRLIDNAPSFRGIFGICANHGGGSREDEVRANHRVIQHSPEMLRALSVINRAFPSVEGLTDEQQKAIGYAVTVLATVKGNL